MNHSASEFRSPAVFGVSAVDLRRRHGLALSCLAAVSGAVVLAFSAPVLIRYGYPAAVVGIGALFIRHRPDRFLALLVLVLVLTPFLRRVVDHQLGWTQISPIMLAPYLLLMLTLPFLLRIMQHNTAGLGPCFGALTAVIVYGFFIAAFQNRFFSAGFDVLRWLLPVSLAAYIVAHHRSCDRMASTFRAVILTATPAVGAYGLWQFFDPPAWDASWMLNSGMDSIGRPLPFEVRVFSTLNAPGACAAFLSLGLLFYLQRTRLLGAPGLLLGGIAFLLTLARAPWLGFAIAAIPILLGRPSFRVLATLMLAVAATVIVIGSDVELNDQVGNRLQSLFELSGDDSASQRLLQYQFFTEDLDTLIIGTGLGINGQYQTYMAEGVQRYIDSGIIDAVQSFGLVGGFLYLACFAALTVVCLGPSRSDADTLAARAFVLGVAAQLPFGSVLAGEWGVLAWACLGLTLAGRCRLRTAVSRPEVLPC
jgi:hypothetical protein